MTTTHFAGIAVALIAAVVLLHRLSWLVWRLVSGMAHTASPHLRGWGELAYAHPLRAAFARRWPRLHAVLARRLSPHRLSGLPLTLISAAALYVLGLFGGLIEDLLQQEGLVGLDETINTFFGPYRIAPLVEAFLWLTAFGSSPAIVAVAVVVSGFLWSYGRSFLLAPLWIAVLGSQATTWAGKFLMGRERPQFIETASAVAPSFPSGHATAAMAVYGFLAYALARELPTSRARFELLFWTAVLIAAIGFSRIFLSLHYASDVLAGFLVGTFWLLVGFAFAAQHAGGSRGDGRS